MDSGAGNNHILPARLLRTPKPYRDENLMGFVLRAAESNGYEKPGWVLELSGLEHQQFASTCSFVFSQTSNLARLAGLTGADLSELITLSYSPAQPEAPATDHLFFDSPIPKYFIRATYTKVCPECLRETNYCRKVWDLFAVTACPVHKILLADECRRCNRRIKWNRQGVSVCYCESDLRNSDRTSVEESELRLSTHIYRLCGLLDDRDADGGNNPLLPLTLNDFLSVVIFIAGQYRNVFTLTGKNIATRIRNREAHDLLSKAFLVFENWPQNYFEYLAWRQGDEGNRRRRSGSLHTGLHKDFGSFYEGLYHHLKAEQFDFLRVAFEEYLSQGWDGGHVGVVLNRRKTTPTDFGVKKYVTMREAKEQLRTRFDIIDRLVQTGKLKAIVQTKNKNRLFLVDAESLAALKQEWESHLSFEEVMGRLGVVKKTVYGLIRRGVINAVRGPTIDGTRVWKFSGTVIDDLFGKIRARIPEPAGPRIGDELNFNEARCRINCLIVADFITAIFRGEISPCGETTDVGLSRFVFKREAVAAYAESRGLR